MGSSANQSVAAKPVSRANPSNPPQTETFSFYPGVNSPFGDLSTLLTPPPPPPPPPTLKQPIGLQDTIHQNPPPVSQVVLLGNESWTHNNIGAHSSRIPSWALELSNNDATNNISSHNSTAFFSNQDVDLRLFLLQYLVVHFFLIFSFAFLEEEKGLLIIAT